MALRAGAALLACMIQAPILFLFVIHPASVREGPPQREMTIALDRATDPQMPFEPAEPSLLRPRARGDIAPPTIQVVDTTREQDLPPRPDPAHPNAQPSTVPFAAAASPANGQLRRSLVVLLRALVHEDGTIADTVLVGSCGVPVLDDLAAAFVKAHWKFLPATENGQPVAKWTSLEALVVP